MTKRMSDSAILRKHTEDNWFNYFINYYLINYISSIKLQLVYNLQEMKSWYIDNVMTNDMK